MEVQAMSKLDYDISKRYSSELLNISNKLNQLERGRIYELSRAQMDGYLSTNISQLKDMLNDLLGKIQNDGKSQDEKMSEELTKAGFFKETF